MNAYHTLVGLSFALSSQSELYGITNFAAKVSKHSVYTHSIQSAIDATYKNGGGRLTIHNY